MNFYRFLNSIWLDRLIAALLLAGAVSFVLAFWIVIWWVLNG